MFGEGSSWLWSVSGAVASGTSVKPPREGGEGYRKRGSCLLLPVELSLSQTRLPWLKSSAYFIPLLDSLGFDAASARTLVSPIQDVCCPPPHTASQRSSHSLGSSQDNCVTILATSRLCFLPVFFACLLSSLSLVCAVLAFQNLSVSHPLGLSLLFVHTL